MKFYVLLTVKVFDPIFFQAIQTTSKGFLLKCCPGKYPVFIFKQWFKSMANREIVITFAFY